MIFPLFHNPRQTRSQTNKPHGFSLIELLVVVAILAILAAIAIPTFLNQKKKAADGVVTSELKTLASALASSMVADNVVVSAGADGNPASNSGNVTIDGAAVPKNGAIVFVNTSTNPKQWCVSRQSSSGRIYSASNTNRSVFESTGPCTSAGTVLTAGTNTSGTIVSVAGNLFNMSTVSSTNGSYVLSSAQTLCSANSLSFTQTSNTYYNLSKGFSVNVATGDTLTTNYAIYPTGNVTTVRIMWGTNAGNTYTDLHNLTPNQWNSFSDTLVVPALVNSTAVTNINAVNMLIGGATGNGTGYVDCYGTWTGTGGVWAPPGQPIYK